jgi:hypothetical protein
MESLSLSIIATLTMVFASGGGGVDLLDLVSTEGYWRSKGVEVTVEGMIRELQTPAPKPPDVARLIRDLGAEDYETRERAERQLSTMGSRIRKHVEAALTSKDTEAVERARRVLAKLGGARVRQIRRLMAIRTLGEKKDRRGLPALRGLVGSKDFFTADYARAAVAAIEGKPYRRPPSTAAEREADVKLLPAGTGIVLQQSIALSKRQPVDRALPTAQAASVPAGAIPPGTAQAAIENLIRMAERVGNFRVQTTTKAVAATVGPGDGFGVMVARGHLDAEGLRRALRGLGASTRKIGTIEAYRLGSMMLMPLSDRRLVAASAPKQENLPLAALAEAVRSGDGGLTRDPKMAALLKAADQSKGLWGVARISDSYRQLDFLAPFDEAHLTAEPKADGLHLRLTAAGTDARKVRQAVARFEERLKDAREQFGRQAEHVPFMKHFAAFLETISAKADGAQATVTAKLMPGVDLESMAMAAIAGGAITVEMAPADEQGVQVIPDPPP